MQLAGTLHGSRHSCRRKCNRNSYGHCTQIPFWPDEVTSMPVVSTLVTATCVNRRQKAAPGELSGGPVSLRAGRSRAELNKFLVSHFIIQISCLRSANLFGQRTVDI